MSYTFIPNDSSFPKLKDVRKLYLSKSLPALRIGCDLFEPALNSFRDQCSFIDSDIQSEMIVNDLDINKELMIAEKGDFQGNAVNSLQFSLSFYEKGSFHNELHQQNKLSDVPGNSFQHFRPKTKFKLASPEKTFFGDNKKQSSKTKNESSIVTKSVQDRSKLFSILEQPGSPQMKYSLLSPTNRSGIQKGHPLNGKTQVTLYKSSNKKENSEKSAAMSKKEEINNIAKKLNLSSGVKEKMKNLLKNNLSPALGGLYQSLVIPTVSQTSITRDSMDSKRDIQRKSSKKEEREHSESNNRQGKGSKQNIMMIDPKEKRIIDSSSQIKDKGIDRISLKYKETMFKDIYPRQNIKKPNQQFASNQTLQHTLQREEASSLVEIKKADLNNIASFVKRNSKKETSQERKPASKPTIDPNSKSNEKRRRLPLHNLYIDLTKQIKGSPANSFRNASSSKTRSQTLRSEKEVEKPTIKKNLKKDVQNTSLQSHVDRLILNTVPTETDEKVGRATPQKNSLGILKKIKEKQREIVTKAKPEKPRPVLSHSTKNAASKTNNRTTDEWHLHHKTSCNSVFDSTEMRSKDLMSWLGSPAKARGTTMQLGKRGSAKVESIRSSNTLMAKLG